MNPLQAIDSFLFSSIVQTQVGLRLLIASVELVVLAFLFEVVTQLLRKSAPRLKACMWALILVKPLLTLAIGSPFVIASFEIAAETVPPTSITGGEPGPEMHRPLAFSKSSQDPSFFSEQIPGELPSSSSRVAWITIPLRREWLLALLTLCWVIGICWGGVHWTLAGYRLKCIISRGEEPSPRTLRIYQEEVQRSGFERPPKLLISPEVESPVLFGAFRPVVVLPAWLEDREKDVLQNLFRHELTHHRHRDSLCLAVAQLCLVLFFFHPVAHWAYRRWLCYAELACDRAIVSSDEEARDYARQLFSVLEGMQMRQAALSGLYATRHQIGTRINALLENPMAIPARLDAVGRIFVLLFVFLFLLFGFGVDTVQVSDRDDNLFIGTFDGERPAD